ncbi:MAG: hypothetical protein DLM65_08300 [Candidatus Aeolococcus gillhamiae]|uniref:Uncharacterized protein n=1 Tax=Candidatus Aeolococcus gillhamiae TaxID=3127015 RepID=A0A2W6AA85_9BACT|nr:MAG: hypothetical protein DLM65_08300 [Candidatus Dormibacter sp. RRmetagenome_bin12]
MGTHEDRRDVLQSGNRGRRVIAGMGEGCEQRQAESSAFGAGRHQRRQVGERENPDPGIVEAVGKHQRALGKSRGHARQDRNIGGRRRGTVDNGPLVHPQLRLPAQGKPDQCDDRHGGGRGVDSSPNTKTGPQA